MNVGVIANSEDYCIVREFFELFKIPWEFYQPDRQYEVVLCTVDMRPEKLAATVVLLYSGDKTTFDVEHGNQIQDQRRRPFFSYGGSRLPIYGNSVVFGHQDTPVLTDENSRECVAYVDCLGDKLLARIGYDLFREVHTLLTKGQPATNGGIPTLELHIALLRDLIVGCGVPLVEIPPVPRGYPFIACLTHDLDHASIRKHKFDPTMFGFLYRATLGSAVNVVRGRLPLRKLFTNCAAAAKLPFIYLGLAKDFWYEFDRYLEIEKGRPSTFFVIPFAGYSGRSSQGRAPRARGSGYDVSDIAEKIPQLMAAGCEIGLHGIDAWLESANGREEARRISEISATTEMGVRMHWLYSDEQSPVVLEEAEFSYDSTVGYNETIGYRAGTTQAFKPLQVTRLLELPMHVMDTALFYPSRLNLSPKQAWARLTSVLDDATGHGGVFTVNWHDRSIAPERLWGDFYVSLLDELTTRGAWFSTAAQAVSWFRKRRSAVFHKAVCEDGRFCATVTADGAANLPGLRLRFHQPRLREPAAKYTNLRASYIETGFDSSISVQFA